MAAAAQPQQPYQPYHQQPQQQQQTHQPPQEQQGQQQQLSHQGQPPAPLPGTTAAARQEVAQARSEAAEARFKGSFVSSGVRGGDRQARAEIVLPKQARAPAQRALPPPPVPVTQVPLYLQQAHRQHGVGGGGYRPPAAAAAAAPPPQQQTAALQQAIAQASGQRDTTLHNMFTSATVPQCSCAVLAPAQLPGASHAVHYQESNAVNEFYAAGQGNRRSALRPGTRGWGGPWGAVGVERKGVGRGEIARGADLKPIHTILTTLVLSRTDVGNFGVDS